MSGELTPHGPVWKSHKLSWNKPHRVVCDACEESHPFNTLAEAKAWIDFHAYQCNDNDGIWRVDAGIIAE